MPKRSERQEKLAKLQKIMKILFAIEGMDTPEFDAVMDEYAFTYSSRFLYDRVVIPKSDGLRAIFLRYNDDCYFRQWCRVDKQTFWSIEAKIKDHPVFGNNSPYSQHPVWVQLLVALFRFGGYGNHAGRVACARLHGISVGTVTNFTKRVMVALISLKDRWIHWPNADERQQISLRFERDYGLPGAVGIVDGTYCNFDQRPAVDGEVFFNRTCRYSYNVQLVCDDQKLIRYYVVGWPGSVYDQTVWASGKVFSNPNQFFSPNQFLLADAGYTLTKRQCTPYKQPEASLPYNMLFNELFSSARVIIEHTNGLLKSRWKSLTNMRVQIREKADLKYACQWVLCCLILHNMTIVIGDKWRVRHPAVVEENIDDEEEEEIELYDTSDGEDIRDRVHFNVMQWHQRVHN
jgi:hypothetical protein